MYPLRRRFWLGLWLPLGLAAGLCAALPAAAWLLARGVLRDEPAVAAATDIEPADIARVLALVRAHDPRRLPPGQLDAVVLGERDLDVLINHFAYRRLGVTARVSLKPGVAEVQASLHLPANPVGRWLNVRVKVVETAGLPQISALQIGALPLPGWLGPPLLRHAAERAGLTAEWTVAADLVRRVTFQPQQLALSVVLRPDSAERLVAALVPPAEQRRLRAYSDLLVTLASTQTAASGSSLAQWLGPMFELARQRSRAGGDAVAENRAAIVALTLYANGRSLDRLLPAARHWPQPQPQRLTLAGRDDSPLHLLISAALAVEGSSPLSRAVGLYKELADSRGGSGFSFNDLAANRAGTRLGEMAVQQPLRLQAALAGGVQETDFMPHAADLPESMAEAEFKRRFGGVGEPRYMAMVAEIDRRVGALAVLR